MTRIHRTASSAMESVRKGWRAVFSLALVMLSVTFTASSAFSHSNACDEQILSLDLMIQVKVMEDLLKTNSFTVNRSLQEYLDSFPDLFEQLKRHAGGVWMDAGTGEAQALVQYLADRPEMHVFGLSFERPPGAPGKNYFVDYKTESYSFTYMDGRYIEDIPDEELAGKDIDTDFYGPFTYSWRIHKVLNKYFRATNPGGVIEIISFWDNYYVTPNGTPVPIFQWIESIPELAPFTDVISSKKYPWRKVLRIRVPPEGMQYVFPDMDLVEISGNPPIRKFKLRNAP